MEQDQFQLEFGWKELIAFIFFFTVSLSTIFFLGFIQGKNKLSKQNFLVAPAQQEQVQSKKSEDNSENLLLEKNRKTETKVTKSTKVLPNKILVEKKEIPKKNKLLLEKNKYVIQLVAYLSRIPAERLQKKLKEDFFPAYISTSEQEKNTFYRVRVGSYSLQEAKEVGQKIKEKYASIDKVQILKID